MRIQGQYHLPGSLVLQPGPGSDAFAGPVPSLRSGHLRRFTQPEVTAVHHLETVFLVPQRAVLAFLFPVFASYPHYPVFGKALLQVQQLPVQHFLRPYNLRIVETDGIRHSVFSEPPVVQAVARVVVSHIKTHYIDRLILRYSLLSTAASHRQQRSDQKCPFFHIFRLLGFPQSYGFSEIIPIFAPLKITKEKL